MPAILIASLEARAGRTTTATALGAILAEEGRPVQLARLRSEDERDPGAEDDAHTLALVPGCQSSDRGITEQEARSIAVSEITAVIEAPPGNPTELAAALSARIVFATARTDDEAITRLSAATTALGDAYSCVVVLRQPQQRGDALRLSLEGRGLRVLAVVPEDRALGGPTTRELAEALRASPLVPGVEDEGVEFVMLGPISADPGQPYFLQHGSKAVINRFDKMDLHLAALAAQPDCLILTGGQRPTPYLLDRVTASEEVAVLLAPEDTARAIELVDGVYATTRFCGTRKVARAIELFRPQLERVMLRSLIE